jgi:hypothetical protein
MGPNLASPAAQIKASTRPVVSNILEMDVLSAISTFIADLL